VSGRVIESGPSIAAAPTLQLRDIEKRYGQVSALSGVNVTANAGEVTALVGDNGAGKSTLIKAIAGVHRIDAGQILLDGEPIQLTSPRDATEHGIETVYQDLALCDNLDVAANLYLGRELRRHRSALLDGEAMEARSSQVISELGARLPGFDVLVSALSGGQRQAVAVSRAALWGSRVVLLDEPTAALGVTQTAMVYDLIRSLRDKGLAIVVVSHNLADVFALADRIVVLRLGRNAGEFVPSESSPEAVVAAITGADTVGEGR